MTDAPEEKASGFDNRRMSWRQKIHGLLFRRGRLKGGQHFRFEANGKNVVYCYIRKNACSAFKSLICEESPHRSHLPEYPDPIRFMRRHHAVRSATEVAAADHVIFVYRDPLERAVSLFKNKFIMRSGHEDIFANYSSIAKQAPDQASFRDFVFRYLVQEHSTLDPHCHSQYAHLFPVAYTDAIPMKSLRNAMEAIIGSKLSNQYFTRKVNATEAAIQSEESACDIPSADLHKRYQQSAALPSSEALLDETITRELQEIYADDFSLVNELAARQRPNAVRTSPDN